MRNGHIKRITDQDIQSSVLEIMGTNVSTNYITCPAEAKKTLGIKLPFLVMIIKNVRTAPRSPSLAVPASVCLPLCMCFRLLTLQPCGVSLCLQLKKYFTFEVQVLDDKNVRRRFRASNYQVSHSLSRS